VLRHELADHGPQRHGQHRFLQQIIAASGCLPQSLGRDIAADQERRHPRVERPAHALYDLNAIAAATQLIIGNDEIWDPLSFRQSCDRSGFGGSGGDGAAPASQ